MPSIKVSDLINSSVVNRVSIETIKAKEVSNGERSVAVFRRWC